MKDVIAKIFGKKEKKAKSFTRVFFATDVHGSDRSFRKFVATGGFYKADVLIMGGDITGKVCVPIVETSPGRFEFDYQDTKHVVDRGELEAWEKTISDSGAYVWRTDSRTSEELSSSAEKKEELFTQLMIERLKSWIEIAEKNLRGTGISCYMTGGNDDKSEVVEILKDSDYIVDPEGKVVRIDEHHEMISTGYSNPSPWKCPRELPEDELFVRIDEMASKVEDVNNCIFNLHAPPLSSGLDNCPRLDTSVFPPRPLGGEFASAGSTAVLQSIEKYQPLLGLHGHIHESRGAVKIHKSLCINPGSEYSEGIIRGAIINLAEKGILSYQLTSG